MECQKLQHLLKAENENSANYTSPISRNVKTIPNKKC